MVVGQIPTSWIPFQFCTRQKLKKLFSSNVMHLLGPRTVECRHNSSLVKGPEQGYSTVLLANLSQITQAFTTRDDSTVINKRIHFFTSYADTLLPPYQVLKKISNPPNQRNTKGGRVGKSENRLFHHTSMMVVTYSMRSRGWTISQVYFHKL